MEASAHAIALRKLDGVRSDVAIFTNFSQDHLDFFHTMEEYARAKTSFFVGKFVRNVVTNADDELGKNLATDLPRVTYSIKSNADIMACNVKVGKEGCSYALNAFGQEALVTTKLAGEFNV